MEKEYPFYNGTTLLMDDRFFKLTTDTVLLSAFVQVKSGQKGLDLGAGIGSLGLLVMLRNQGVAVDGIEISQGAADLAQKNYAICSKSDLAKVTCGDYTKLTKCNKYDFCVTNPPYFSPQAGLHSQSAEIDTARRGELFDVFSAAAKMLKPAGKLFMCLRAERLGYAVGELEKAGFCAKRIRFVHNTLDSQASIVMIEAIQGKGEPKIEKPLILKDQSGYTKEYQEIYGTW